jgi:alpha-N-arabinofuranosidase
LAPSQKRYNTVPMSNITGRVSQCVLVLSLLAANLYSKSISHYIRTNGNQATIEIHAADRAPFRIPRTVYGTFLEDIGHSIFGGVSAQLLENPSLEDYSASLTTLEQRFSSPEFQHASQMGLPMPWLPLRDTGWRFEPRWGNAANSERYLFVLGLPGREVGIRQTIYLPIERELDYSGALFAICEEGSTELTVSFRVHDKPDATLASVKVQIPAGRSWTKLPFHLSLPAGVVKPLEPLDFVLALNDGHRVSIDGIRLYPDDAIEGLDAEIVKVAKALNSPLLRFGGNFTSGYHWRDGIGPVDSRPTKLNQAWGFPEYNEFGTDEFMHFCRLIGAKPQMCLNLGSGTPEEARGWVEYCQGGPETAGGSLRAKNGHADPYPVAAWELGNELWGDFQIGWQTAEGNAERYRTFLGAIRNRVPKETMLFANGADVDFYKDWNAALINKAGPDLSYLTTHFVVGMDDMVDKSADRDTTLAADFAIPTGVANGLEHLRAQIESNEATRDRVKAAFTEWLFASPEGSNLPRWDNLGGAIITGAWMNMILTRADFVPVSDMTGLMEFGGIYKRRGRVYVTPQYWAFSLYTHHAGDSLLATETRVRHYDVHKGNRRVPEIPDVPYLDVLATQDSRTGDLVLFVVNRDWKNSIPATLQLMDFTPERDVLVETLTADSILAKNDEEHPDAVKPVSSKIEASGPELLYTFPEHSLTVLTFRHKS